MVKNFKTKHSIKKIQENVLEIAIELARKGEGALFVISDKSDYHLLIKQEMPKLDVFDSSSRKILFSLAQIDGAVIINTQGKLIAYGAMIKKAKPFVGYGTRHAAAVTASKTGVAILCSEEERKVKIFKDGKFVMQIDALQKNIEKQIPAMSKILESVGVGFLGMVGATVLAPSLGIALLPGVVVFGASYYAIHRIVDYFRE